MILAREGNELYFSIDFAFVGNQLVSYKNPELTESCYLGDMAEGYEQDQWLVLSAIDTQIQSPDFAGIVDVSDLGVEGFTPVWT